MCARLDLMLEEYYDKRGWEAGGVVSEAKLKSLDIL
jgi:aldehyde:ferredoxin oxidoreductase